MSKNNQNTAEVVFSEQVGARLNRYVAADAHTSEKVWAVSAPEAFTASFGLTPSRVSNATDLGYDTPAAVTSKTVTAERAEVVFDTAPDANEWKNEAVRDWDWEDFVADQAPDDPRLQRWAATAHASGDDQQATVVLTCERMPERDRRIEGRTVADGDRFLVIHRDSLQPALFPAAQAGMFGWAVAENGPEEVLCSGEYRLAHIVNRPAN